MNPKVSVLMACKNSNLELLKASINSVLEQSYSDFEFVIVDDGSDSPIESKLKEVIHDKRIKIFRIQPSGLGAALTFGIKQSVGEFIARIDDDDLMTKDRLEKQVHFLEQHQEVCCVGANRYSYCHGHYIKHKKFPTIHEDIVNSMLSLKWAMAHSALMYRRESALKVGCYRIKGTGEDLDFILQLSLIGKLANLDDYLLYYYLNLKSLSAVNSQIPGHIYAIKEFKKSSGYEIHRQIVDQSLSWLEDMELKKKKQFQWKKWLLMLIIRFLGRKMPVNL